jgi:hypothetical protein
MNRTLALLTALLLPSLAALHAADAPPRPAKPIAEYVQPAPRSVRERVFDVWRNEGRFTKNPDIIELPSGRLVLGGPKGDAALSVLWERDHPSPLSIQARSLS